MNDLSYEIDRLVIEGDAVLRLLDEATKRCERLLSLAILQSRYSDLHRSGVEQFQFVVPQAHPLATAARESLWESIQVIQERVRKIVPPYDVIIQRMQKHFESPVLLEQMYFYARCLADLNRSYACYDFNVGEYRVCLARFQAFEESWRMLVPHLNAFKYRCIHREMEELAFPSPVQREVSTKIHRLKPAEIEAILNELLTTNPDAKSWSMRELKKAIERLGKGSISILRIKKSETFRQHYCVN